ncbi:hypothetical protein Kpol_1036p34 [Vanderwaltozyma polyspora DSM 70294]|uniref:chitin synthase n=1 Tax=Vanderwaltozyma polyspora (strain ATCC 22028 / DSM 70294 / BCRC 21397 / CBS 2163 / NBRC 10782 / NRRL Y-8283 / UCD 57-17) TaxID=436907 RepID=A7TEI3_VANPO|nr:uncharacterized protein Kpol_1036p34 [Vanderwaltozyma polyspora DSM 70294]EDO19290.1 hypothetical protein Kpol_1036p34 [Vanderwaltozyma polyspora DSM 70294]
MDVESHQFPSDGDRASNILLNYSDNSPNFTRHSSLIRPERDNLEDPHNPHHYYAKKIIENQDHIKIGAHRTISRPINAKHFRDNFPFDVNEGSLRKRRNTNLSYEYSKEEMKSEKTDKEVLEVIGITKKSFQKNAGDDRKTKIRLWKFYCYFITFWAPPPVLKFFGMPKRERQIAWREKIGLISIVFYMAGFVAFLTFGFTKTVCRNLSLHVYHKGNFTDQLLIHGKVFDLQDFKHPEAPGVQNNSNILYPPYNANGMDASLLFQNVNGNCKGLIIPKENCSIPHTKEGDVAWYFPCTLMKVDGTSLPEFQESKYYDGWGCHTSDNARRQFYTMNYIADVYYKWEDLKSKERDLVVVNGEVLDLNILNWLDKDQLSYPSQFDELQSSALKGYDLSILSSNYYQQQVLKCLIDIARVGRIDSKSIGCIASDVVLLVSLTIILGVVMAKFLVACYFRWKIAKNQGAYPMNNQAMEKYMKEIERWSNEMEFQGPLFQEEALSVEETDGKHSTIENNIMNSTISSSKLFNFKEFKLNMSAKDLDCSAFNGITTMVIQNQLKQNMEEINLRSSYISGTCSSSTRESLMTPIEEPYKQINSFDPSLIHPKSLSQPSVFYMPHNFPLVHIICFVTCYSEGKDGLRTTLDSLSNTEYPATNKLLLVVCDGLIKGSGNEKTTPEIVLGMMQDFIIPPDKVEAYSYIAVASGSKRHNMAKVYGGFYKYDDNTTPTKNQKRVPMITIVKCGTIEESNSSKPGNRGKRDSQVILMSFLQKLTFDERMNELEYNLLKTIWHITGLMGDMYELVLMVDADTKVYPDSLTHMAAEMIKDPSIMGLCGETKIVNKAQSWVTAIQVFEYFISHHQAKAFESVFGSVTCLPGCFSMYRIKSPKGFDGYWVPILANPDIVERYSDNVTNTLHKKNLLLLGEDRYLSSLMLKTFPKRRQIFVPKAACKTVVPDKFKVLLSQRRRWINSTVHNLFELLLIRDLCGTFCFSMQFVIGIELIGTLVLPLAICFTIYVITFTIVSEPTPVITLIILGIILGLPGLVVIITATGWSYLIWMLAYILALPIWNFVLPVYAFWKFDDFSWGDTRPIAGDDKNPAGHDDIEGPFDYSTIKMQTWRQFIEEERSQIF